MPQNNRLGLFEHMVLWFNKHEPLYKKNIQKIMFKKLLSNLPFNPSLIGQVSFYARRMKRESSVRRIGLIFMVLAMGVQLLAAANPAQATLTGSTNDIIRNGFDNKEQAVLHCLNGSLDFYEILTYYGLGCDDLANSTDGGTIRSNAADYYSLGRNPVSNPSPRNGKTWDIYPVTIPDVTQTLYMKDLQYWDSGAYSDYPVLKIIKGGRTFYILKDCGNIVTEGRYSTPLPPPPVSPPPVVIPKAISCSNLVMNVADGSKLKLGGKVTVRGQAAGQNIPAGQKVDMQYDFVNGAGKVLATNKSIGVPFQGMVANDSKTYTYSSDTAGQYTVRLTVRYDSTKIAAGSASGNCVKRITVERPCEDVKTTSDLELCLVLNKSAKNSSQNIADANGTTAKADDVVEYTLSVTNSGKVTVPKFVIKENMNDVLEYANITDLHGGQLDKDNYIFWPAVDIKPSQTIQKLITVRVKNPIPATPVSTSDPGSFNLIMTNVYGDSVNINLPGSIVKQVELTTTLPNTGPGENLAIGFALTVVIGYFFARSRLFVTELDIVRQDFSNGGA